MVLLGLTDFMVNCQLGLTDDIGDLAFAQGQLARAQILGDNGTIHNGIFDPSWRSEFKGDIHGIILVRISTEPTCHIPDSNVTT